MNNIRRTLLKNCLRSLVILIGLSCKNDDPYDNSDIPVITGYYARDVQGGSPTGRRPEPVGTPNTRLQNGSGNSVYSMVSFPNPVTSNRFNVALLGTQDTEKKKIWIIPGRWVENSKKEPESKKYTDDDLDRRAVLQAELSSSQVQFDASQLSAGYYRVYVKLKEDYLYDNILLKK